MKKRKVTPKKVKDPNAVAFYDEDDGPIPQWLVDICLKGRREAAAGKVIVQVPLPRG